MHHSIFYISNQNPSSAIILLIQTRHDGQVVLHNSTLPTLTESIAWSGFRMRKLMITQVSLKSTVTNQLKQKTIIVFVQLASDTFKLLGHRPSRPTGAWRPDPHRATERARRRGPGTGAWRRDPHWTTERARRRGYAHRTTKRATRRGNGPRPTGDQTRRHNPPDGATPRRNRYRTGASTREVEGIRPEAPGRAWRGTDRTALYVRRQVEGIWPDRTGWTEQQHTSAVGVTAAPRSTARLTF